MCYYVHIVAGMSRFFFHILLFGTTIVIYEILFWYIYIILYTYIILVYYYYYYYCTHSLVIISHDAYEGRRSGAKPVFDVCTTRAREWTETSADATSERNIGRRTHGQLCRLVRTRRMCGCRCSCRIHAICHAHDTYTVPVLLS